MALPLAPSIVGRNTGHGSAALRIKAPLIDGSTVATSYVVFRDTSAAFDGTSAVIDIAVDGTGGTFDIVVNGQTASAIPANSTAAVVQAALEALSNVAPGDVTVVRAGDVNAYTYTLTFEDTGLLAFTVITLTTPDSLTGGAGTAVPTVVTQGVVPYATAIGLHASGYTQWYDESNSDDTDYYYTVRAKNAEGYSSGSNSVHILRKDTNVGKLQDRALKPAKDVTILASAARTALVAATDLQVPHGTKMVEVIIDVTSVTATPALTFTIEDANGVDLLVSGSIATVSQTILRYGTDLTNVTNLAQQGIPTKGMTIKVAVGDTDSATYSVTRRVM